MANHQVGLFTQPEPALAAAAKLQQAGYPRPELMSPIPIEGVDEVLGERPSVIRRFTLFGAIFGAIFGFSLAAGTAVLYLHPAGGRPIISLPPFLIISYEMTILFGILATVLGFFISARLPVLRERVYLPQTAVDKFAVVVVCNEPKLMQAASLILQQAGAEEVLSMTEED